MTPAVPEHVALVGAAELARWTEREPGVARSRVIVLRELEAWSGGADPTVHLAQRLVGLWPIVIAAHEGAVAGGALALSLRADLRVAGESASFAFVEGGGQPDLVANRLRRIVGDARAAQWLAAMEPVPAAAARAAGLVARVATAGDALTAALALAREIAANAPIAVQLIKRGLARAHDESLESMMRLEDEGVVRCSQAADLLEGVRAFLEKRAPRFTGA
jgi:enoyl-CoA hydratase/carnithine racemase